MPLLLGLDLGTTSAKAVVFDQQGRVLSQGRAATPWTVTDDGVELAPSALLGCAVEALREAVDAAPGEEPVAGVGITSMGESGVLVDEHGDPVAPLVAWHDVRDHAEVAELRAEIGEDEFCATTGKPLRGQFSLTKHRWLVRHLDTVARARRRFNVAEYVVRSLGGDPACELSLASRTGWFDIVAGDWWAEGLAFSGASASLMPPLVRAGDPLGRITGELVPPRLHGAVLTVVGHDHQAAAVGAGATGEGDELDSCGTAEALVRTVAPTLDRDQIGFLARHGVTTDWSVQPGRWSLLAATEGGLAMQRTLGMLGVGRDGLAALDRAAATAPVGRVRVEGVGGESLTVAGLHDGVTPAEVWRAVVQEATDQAVVLHDAMARVAGPHAELVVTGGWANSTTFLAAKSAGFGPYRRSDVVEAGARGAALFGAYAAGVLTPGTGFLPETGA
ncbi:MAG: xylulose kinase [Friedmanniella sp.]|nr:xylulose kinase [Friedmanniella sp.]